MMFDPDEAWLTEFDKTQFQAVTMDEADRSDREFWLTRTPIQRLKALEHIRQLAWGYDDDSQPEFPRTAQVLKLGES